MRQRSQTSVPRPTAERPVFESMEPRLLLQGHPLITEFMADNGDTLYDQSGATPDWIEIYNPTADPIDLGGYYLTDDPDDLGQWTRPSPARNSTPTSA